MPDLPSILFGIYFFVAGFVMLIGAVSIRILTFPFDRTGKLTHYYTSFCSFHYMRMSPGWSCRFDGLDNIDPNKSYVMVSNHQSLMDILVLFGIMRQFKWVSKDEMFKVPVIGWTLAANSYVRIKRGDTHSVKDMLKSCQYWLDNNVSVMMFPEGTRSDDGEIQKFRYGAFKLAADRQVEIIPIVVDGTRQIMSKGSLLIGFRSDIKVRALPPVNPRDFNNDSHALTAHVRMLMVNELTRIRQEAKETAAIGVQVS